MKSNDESSADFGNAEKLKGMLGFAKRAGKLSFGYDAVVKDIKGGKVKAVIISCDAAKRTASNIKEVCENAGVSSAVLPFDKEVLGRSIGRDGVAVAAVTDKSFAKRILELATVSE